MPITPGGNNSVQVDIEGDASSLTSAIDNAVGGLNTLSSKVALASGALAAMSGGAMKNSIESAMDFEDAMVEVEKVTNPEVAEEMGTAIKGMASEMPLAQEELAGIAAQAGRLGVEGADNIESYTETVGQMAVATDLTAEEAADAFARIGTLMNIPVEESENLGSAMNELSNNMGTSASEITDVMVRAGASFEQLGVGEQEALALSAAMNEVSPSSRLAAGGMKRMAEAMMDPGNVEDFAAALGVSSEEFVRMRKEDPSGTLLAVAEQAANSEDSANILKDALGKAGQEFVTLGSNADGAREAIDTSNEAWDEATSLQTEFDAAAGTLSSQIQILKNNIKNLSIGIGMELIPYVSAAVEAFIEFLKPINEWVSEGDNAKRVAQALAAVFGGSLVVFLVSTASALIGMVGAAGLASAAIGGLVTAALTLTGIGGIIALAYAWQNNFGGIRDATMEVVDVIQDEFAPIIQKLGSWVGPIMNKLSYSFSFLAMEVENAVSYIVGALKGPLINAIRGLASFIMNALVAMENFWKAHGTEIENAVMDAYFTVRGFIISAVQTLGNIIGPILNFLGGLWDKHGSTVLAIAGGIALAIGTLAQKFGILSNTLMPTAQGFMSILKIILKFLGPVGIAISLVITLYQVWESNFLGIRDIVEDAITAIEGIINDVLPGIVDFITGIIDSITGIFEGGGGDWGDTIDNAIATVEAIIEEGMAVVEDIFGGVVDTITNVLEGLGEIITTIFGKIEDLWNAHGDRIVSIISMALEIAWMIFSNILELIMFTVGEFLTMIMELWDAHGQEIIALVSEAINRVMEIFNKLVDIIVPIVTTFIELLAGAFHMLMSIILPIIQSFLETVLAFWKEHGDSIMTIVKGAISLIMTVFQTGLDFILTLFRAAFTIINGILEAFSLLLEGDVVGAFWAMLDAVMGVLPLVWDFIVRTFNSIIEWLLGWGPRVLQAVMDVLWGIVQAFLDLGAELIWGSVIPDIFNAIFTFIQDIFVKIKDKIVEVLTAIATWIGEKLTAIKEKFTEIWNAVKTFITEVWTSMKEFITETLNTISTKINEVWTAIKEFLTETLNAISTKINEIWTAIKEFLTETLNTISTKINEIWTGIKEFLTETLNAISTKINEIWTAIKEFLNETLDAISTKVNEIWTGIKDFLSETLEAISTKINEIWTAIKDFLSETLDTIQTTFEDIWNAISEFLSETFEAIQTKAEEIWNAIKDFIDETLNTIQTTFEDIWDAIETFLSDTFDSIKQTAEDSWNAIKDFIDTKLGEIQTLVEDTFNEILSTLKSILEDMVQAVKDIKEKLKSAVKDVVNAGLDVVKDMAGAFKDAGKGLINAMVDGISGAAGKIYKKAKSIAKKAKSYLPFSDAKRGPFRHLTESGEAIPGTLAEGIDRNEGELMKAMEGMAGIPSTLAESNGAAARARAGRGGTGDKFITYEIMVEANSRREGRAAGKALSRELKSHNFNHR